MIRPRYTVRVLITLVAAAALLLGSYRAGRDAVPAPELVWVTRAGERYHKGGCRYLRGGGVRTPLAEARGPYRPCRVCRPPT